MSTAAQDKIRPSGWWIVVAIVTFVVGIGGCSAVSIVAIVNAFDVDTIFSREGSIELDEGSYTVYLTNVLADVSITAPNGEPIELDRYGEADVTVSRDGRDYEATYTFRAPADGRYRVVHDGSGRVAIGEGIAKQLRPLWIVLPVGFVLFVLALVLFIVTLVKRSSSRNRIKAAQFAGGWPGQVYQGPGGPTFGPPSQWGPPPGSGPGPG